MTRSTVTAVVEHNADVDPTEVLRRYTGQVLYNGNRTAVLREVTGVEAIDEPEAEADEPMPAAEPVTTTDYLREILAALRGLHELVDEKL